MGISATYGTGIYNQSRYGVVYITSTLNSFSFLSNAVLEGLTFGAGNTKVEFSSVSIIGLSSPSKVDLLFSDTGHILGGRTGSSSLLFSSHSDLSAASSKIKGNAFVEFSSPSNNLEGNGVLKGEEGILFDTQGLLFGQGEMGGQEQLMFYGTKALTNAKRIKSYLDIKFTIKKSEIFFKNINPYYSTWNGKYIDLNKNNHLSSGYLDLLYAETSGSTNLPYEETISNEHIFKTD